MSHEHIHSSTIYMKTVKVSQLRLLMQGHEQDEEVLPTFAEYERKLSEKHLKSIPMHTEPLLSGTGDYRDIAPSERQQMLNVFLLMVRRLPISYAIFMYKQSDFRDREQQNRKQSILHNSTRNQTSRKQ